MKIYERILQNFNLKITLICLQLETTQQLPFSSLKGFTSRAPNSAFNYLYFIIVAHFRRKIDLELAYSRNPVGFSSLE